ncbi:MAG: CHASE3 domain-containing protein [Bacteroidota bacterium]
MKGILNFFKSHGITVSIAFVLMLIVINAMLVFYNARALEQNRAINKRVEETRASVENILMHVNMADLGLRGYLMIPEENFLEPFTIAKRIYKGNFDKLDSLMRLEKLDTDSLQRVEMAVKEYLALLDRIVVLKDEGKTEQVLAEVRKDEGYKLYQKYVALADRINAHQDKLAQQAQAKYDSIVFNITSVQVILLIFGIPTLLLTILRVNKAAGKRRKIFEELAKSNKEYVYNSGNNYAQDGEDQVIGRLIRNLKSASNFIKDITNGNYEAYWEGLTDDNKNLNQQNLAGELSYMRDQMKQVKKDDEQRLWSTEGLAKFAEILRADYESFEMMGDEIIGNTVRHLNANQGALYIADETDQDNVFIEMLSCYAYKKKKFVEKRIEPGDGLIGQAYLEGEILNMTSIPDDYVNITSGLGDALPRNLVVVPLKVNDKISGLLELASFNRFQPHELDFLEKLGEMVASTVISARTNDRTRILLEQSQELTEQMRAQEEEMRQNMEELQATQEEMRRKEQGMEDLLHQSLGREKELKEELEALKKIAKVAGTD